MSEQRAEKGTHMGGAGVWSRAKRDYEPLVDRTVALILNLPVPSSDSVRSLTCHLFPVFVLSTYVHSITHFIFTTTLFNLNQPERENRRRQH